MQLTDHAAVEPTATLPSRSPGAVMAALILAQFAAADGVTGIYVMLPSIYREFSMQAGAVSWIVTTFFLVAATMSAVAGRLADLLGRRNVAVTLLFCSCAGGCLGSVAGSVPMLIAASVLLGTSTTLTPILIGLAREHLPPGRIGLGIGAIAAAGSAGSGVIFLVTGVIVDQFGRTGGYLFASILTATAACFLLLGVPRPVVTGFRLRDIDFARGVMFGPAVAGIILAVQLGALSGWSDPIPFVLFVGAVLLAVYWWRDQLRQPRPLLNLRLLSHGQAPRALLGMALLGLPIQQGQIFSLLFQQAIGGGAGFGMSATMAGLMMIPINGTALFVSPLAGVLARRFGARRVAVAGAATMALGWVLAALTFHSLLPLVFSAIISLVGLGLLMPSLYLLIVEATPAEMTSGAAGFGYTLFNVGFAIGSQVLLGILVGSGNVVPDAGRYRNAFAWLAAASCFILVPLLAARRRNGRMDHG